MTINLTDPQAPVTDEELDQMIWKLERDGGMTPKLLSLMRELREVRKLESGLRIAVGIVPLTDGEMSLLLNAEKLNQPVSETERTYQNSFTDAELEMMTHGNNPQANAYRQALTFRRNSPVTPDGWRVEAERLAELHGCSFVVFRHGGEPQCADPTKVIISFTDKGLGYSDAVSAPATHDCQCRTCRPVTMNDIRFVVCPECGNKRCPHANDHNNACTGSNEPGQIGSAYPTVIRDEMKMGARLTNHRFKP